MAIYLKDLTDEETVCLTREMMDSGNVLGPWPEEWKGKVVDKHSTGGVGDKVSLILVPALAACGMKVRLLNIYGFKTYSFHHYGKWNLKKSFFLRKKGSYIGIICVKLYLSIAITLHVFGYDKLYCCIYKQNKRKIIFTDMKKRRQ